MQNLEQTDGFAHRGLDVQGLDVLPVLFEERNEEVDAKHDVGKDLILGHLDVANSNTEAENLLELELDSRANLNKLVREIFSAGDWSGELAGFGKTGTKETRDLLDQGFRRQESVILLGKFLDKLLVLVKLLQVVDGHVLELDLFCAIDIGGIGKNADRHAGAGDIGELHGSGETLVSLGIVVLQADLKFDGLGEVTLFLAVGVSQEIPNGASHAGH